MLAKLFSFLPQVLLAFLGIVVVVVILPVLGPVRTTATGANPISVSCSNNASRGLLIVHQFNSQATCDACRNDPSDCVRRLVGQPSDHNVCPAGNNYLGNTTNPYDGQPTTCSDLGDCTNGSCASTYPNCAAVQVDCLNGLGGGINAGNVQINCNCAPPPPQTHKICVNSACADRPISEQGTSCSSNNDCVPQTHKICVNVACADRPISETGVACTISTDCQPQTHMICKNLACATVPITEQGTACTSNAQCQTQRQTVCDSLSLSPTSGNVSLTVSTGLLGHTINGGSITSYRFNFGDGTGDFVQGGTALNHAFNSTGTFTVRGFVKDDQGTEVGGSGSCSATVTVNTTASQRAVCDGLTVDRNSGTAPLYVNSTLSGHTKNGGSIASYKFNFGDGTGDFNQSGNSLGHTFNSVGTYVISGTVRDNLGNQAGGSACQRVITVGQVLGTSTSPPAIPKTGPETAILFSLFGSGSLGWVLRKFKIRS